MDSWPSEESMMKLEMENNLSETAFIVKEEQGYHLRWFTPDSEVELCGHATKCRGHKSDHHSTAQSISRAISSIGW